MGAGSNTNQSIWDLLSKLVNIGRMVTATVTDTVSNTVAATGTPEALTSTSTVCRSVMLFGKKAARTNNVGVVYVGWQSTNDTQFLDISPGEMVEIVAPPGTKLDLSHIYIDVLNNGDGIFAIYVA